MEIRYVRFIINDVFYLLRELMKRYPLNYFIMGEIEELGRPYFVKSTAMYFLTYNYKTNSMYSGSLINYHKKRKCTREI